MFSVKSACGVLVKRVEGALLVVVLFGGLDEGVEVLDVVEGGCFFLVTFL